MRSVTESELNLIEYYYDLLVQLFMPACLFNRASTTAGLFIQNDILIHFKLRFMIQFSLAFVLAASLARVSVELIE